MNKIEYALLIVLLLFVTLGCNYSKESSNPNNTNEVIRMVKVIIDENEYILNLEDNETVKKFINYLPQELEMSELNGNEKYAYLSTSFPVNPFNPQRIYAGDVMLYGDNCLVIFYQSFDTSYSYTKIGHIDNLPNLGNGNVIVRLQIS